VLSAPSLASMQWKTTHLTKYDEVDFSAYSYAAILNLNGMILQKVPRRGDDEKKRAINRHNRRKRRSWKRE